MEKVKEINHHKRLKRSVRWGLKEMEEDLRASGAIEITPEQMKEARFKKLMKNIKNNGKFICD